MAEPETPGRAARRAKREAAHRPFNARPKDVGTRTGIAMPINVARDSMGFENAAEFFMSSPAGTEAPTTTHTIRTFTGQATSLLRSAAGASTPGPYQTPAPMGKRGKMTQFLGTSDEEDGSGLADDLLRDDDQVLDDRLSSPGRWFETNAPPTISMPKPSQMPAPGLEAGFDDLPTPKKGQSSGRKSRIGVGRESSESVVSPAKSTRSNTSKHRVQPSPAKSTASSRQAVDDLDLELANIDEDEEMDLEQDIMGAENVPPSPSEPASPHVATSPMKSVKANARKSTATSVGGDEYARDADSRLSLASTKSRSHRTELDEEDDDDGDQQDDAAEQSFAADALDNMDVGDQTFDVGGDTGDYEGYDDAGDNSQFQAEEQDYDDVSMEQATVQREDRDEDEESEEEEQVEVRKKPKPVSRSQQPRSQSRTPRVESHAAKKKRMRLSRMGGHEDDQTYQGDFTTRSGRRHIKPLEFWRGEKVNYGNGPGLAVVKEVVRLEKDVKQPLGSKHRGRARSQSARPKRSGSDDPERESFDGLDNETEPIGQVQEFATGRDIQRRVAFPKSRLDPKPVTGSDFKYQKVFGEDQFIASGVVFIPVGGSKPSKQSKDNSYVFYVIAGAVQVTVHKSSFVMAPGGMFMVPRGNDYEIRNVSEETEAELFFAQARKIRMNETDEVAFDQLQDQIRERARSASVAANAKQSRESLGSMRGGQYENEEEEEEESEEEPTPRAKRRGEVGR